MKNVIKFFAIAMFIATTTVQAQEKPACSSKEVEKKVEMMKEKLSLSDEQTAQITVLIQEKTEDFGSKIKEILTPAQYSQFQEMTKGKSCCKKKTDKKTCSKEEGKKSCCKKDANKKACSKKEEKKACDKKSDKKACCKKDTDKKTCSKGEEKKACDKKSGKKACCKKK